MFLYRKFWSISLEDQLECILLLLKSVPLHWRYQKYVENLHKIVKNQINMTKVYMQGQIISKFMGIVVKTGFHIVFIHSYGAWTWLPGPDVSKPPSAIHDSGLGG